MKEKQTKKVEEQEEFVGVRYECEHNKETGDYTITTCPEGYKVFIDYLENFLHEVDFETEKINGLS